MASSLDSTLRHISRDTEEDAARQLAARLGLTYANLEQYPFSLDALSLVALPVVEQNQVAVYLRTASKVRVAIVHAESEQLLEAVMALGEKLQCEVEVTVVSISSMRYLIHSYKTLLEDQAATTKAQAEAIVKAEEENYFHHINSLEDMQSLAAETTNTSALLDIILAGAIKEEASDIHLEPGDQTLIVRLRIDGVLQRVLDLPPTQQKQLVSRIKMMSGMKLDLQNAPQDGRFSLSDRQIPADVRVSTIPTGYGEGVVMRILRQDKQVLTLDQLGFSDYNQGLIDQAIHRPYGLILVTGPTGSGKSTTLYALLQQLNTSERKIITLEDPIEYDITGVQQSQIDTEHGFSFAEGLRGALRQDPDIVMVGEIRDPETATIALNASLTGHLVLSTLHTNNAVTAHTRFLEMGIEPFLLSGSIQAVIAQRLVRRLTPESTPENPVYRGRVVIGEVLVSSQDFEQAVLQHTDPISLQQIAVQHGMHPILQDGLDKVKQGLTTEAEIYRVTAA